MVKLTKIYTRGGDAGETSLGDGSRVSKFDPRVAAYGTVDEANAVLGIARMHLPGANGEAIARIQNDLFDLGADLCRPVPKDSGEDDTALRTADSQVAWLETEIDRILETQQPLTSFVLPGGSTAAAYLHHARTVVRRAEREGVELVQEVDAHYSALRYLNRLSDYLFVLSRHENQDGAGDFLWKPGENR
jgi:cob(I)alamin adenosyltransferase